MMRRVKKFQIEFKKKKEKPNNAIALYALLWNVQSRMLVEKLIWGISSIPENLT